MKRVYPAIFTPEDGGYVVEVPGLDISTQGENLVDAIVMARDAINLTGITLEDMGKEIPAPIDIRTIALEKDQICTLVDCDFEEYRKELDNRAVKKNCTLPSWFNKKAEAAHVNFSAVLQKALMEELHIEQH